MKIWGGSLLNQSRLDSSKAIVATVRVLHIGQISFVWNHWANAVLLNTWKHVVTLAVIGVISSRVIEQISLFLHASSAISQAIRLGRGVTGTATGTTGATATTGYNDHIGWV